MFSKSRTNEEIDATCRALILAADAEGLGAQLNGAGKAALNLQGPDKLPLLFLAVMHDEAECTRLLLAAKAEVNAVDSSAASACFLAARNDAASCLELLIGAGANIDLARRSGATPLYIATQRDSRRCLRLLIDAGADLNAPKEGGFTPLCIGTLRNRKECVGMLVQAGVDVNRAYTVADKFTPLMLASHCDHIEIVGMLCQAEALLTVRDDRGRNALEIARAEGNEVAVSALEAQAEMIVRENELVKEEAMLQELRHLEPCQGDLEVEAGRMEELQAQSAAFASEEGVFGSASELQSACMLIAQSLLPARRLISDLADLDGKGEEMEAHLRLKKAGFDGLQTSLRETPSDARLLAARDAARAEYLQTLVTVKKLYEERQRRGNKYASESDRVGAVAGKAALAAAQANSSGEGGAAEMPAAIGVAMPVLRRCMGELGEANRETLKAMEALSACMAREITLMEQVKAPLQAACATCHGAIAANASLLVGDSPRADLDQLGLLLGEVKKSEFEASRAQETMAAVRHNLRQLESLRARELELADEISELHVRINTAERHGNVEEVAALRSRRAAAEGAVADLQAQAGEVQRQLHEPRLVEWYPEMAKLLQLKRDITEAGSDGPLEHKLRLEHLDLGREIARQPGWHAQVATPKPTGPELTLAQLALPRSLAFERAHATLAALRSPLLLLPSRIFYDQNSPALTFALTPGLLGLEDLTAWVERKRGGAALATAEGLGELTAWLAPLLCAVALLHRHGVLHGAISPAAVRRRPDGAVALTDVGFPHGGALGPYGAPETVHDAPAHAAVPLAADCFSVGAMLLEVLSGKTPRWNQALGRLEDASTSEPLMPAEAPAGPLASAWAVCSGLIQKAPLARLSVAQALLSPLFESLLPADALPADAASCAPFGGVQAWDEAGDGVVLVSVAEGASPLAAALEAAPRLRATSVLRADAAGTLQPAAQLLSASFARVRETGLMVATAADLPLMPRAGPLRAGDEAQYDALGRLLGYCVVQGLHVPLPLPAALLAFLVGAPLPTELGRAIAWLGAFDPPRAQALRCLLAKRHGPHGEVRGATLAALLGETPLEEPGLASLVVSDANKARLAAEVVEQLLLGCRRAALAPLRRGVAAVVGEAALSALRPEELCRRLLGWEQPQEGVLLPRAESECCLCFHASDWGEEALREAYRGWFSQWAAKLPPPRRCALLLLVFGGATGAVLARPTSVLCGGTAEARFLPEAQLLYLPAASSAAEFDERMDAAIVL